MAVCRSCGANAPPTRSRCSICRSDFEDGKARVRPRGDGRYFAKTSVEMRCRSCGYLTSAASLLTSETFLCAHCGLRQAQYAGYWRDVLSDAWNIADLNGVHAQVRDERSGVASAGSDGYHIASIGRTGTAVQTLFGPDDDEFRQRLVVAPGHPVCESCGREAEVQVLPSRRLLVRCERCSTEERHAVPEGARDVPDGLVGVIATSHRTDRLHVAPAPDGTLHALQCPSCAAALGKPGTTRDITCAHCGTTSLLPPTARCQVGDEHRLREWWWLVYEGWSPERKRLIREAAVPKPKPIPKAPSPRKRRKRRKGCFNYFVYAVFITFGLTMLGASVLMVFAMLQEFF
jgi:hypothetical protein